MEGSVSQNFDLGHSFFVLCNVEEGILNKNTKNHES